MSRRPLPQRTPSLGVLVVALLASVVSPHAAAGTRVAALDDAFVEVDHRSGRWTIGNDRIAYALDVHRDGTVDLGGLRMAGSDDDITVGIDPEALVTLQGRIIRLGEQVNRFALAKVDSATGSNFVSLSLRFLSNVDGLVATRHYVVYPHAAAVEMWTEIEAADGAAHTVDNLNAYNLTVPRGDIEWISGLDTPIEEGGAFTRRNRSLADGERLDVSSPTLSSEAAVPYFSIGNGHRRFFTGLVWSGAWSATFERHGGDLSVTMGLPLMSAWVRSDRSVEGPHAFVGVVLDQPGADVAEVTRFVQAGRAGRAFPALTTFNTWFVHGTRIDEAVIKSDIDYASQIGMEMLQIDAGWYPGADPREPFNFTRGLGTWTVDSDRFPSGLAALREYAHARGMKLGVWVEPERIDLATVGREGLAEERFLAQQNGAYQPGVANGDARDGQICLADPAARAWVRARLMQLIDEVGPDNVKWDFNRWVICTREGHGHPADGGNYEHTRGLFEILAAVRQRYPALTVENCSGGGRRLDFAMARLTDAAWMDDRTAPSSHVRYNLDGLTAAFPASYLFSYVMSHPDEPLHGGDDIANMVRSRMPGVVGLTADFSILDERELNELHQQMELAKQLRVMQTGAITYTLAPHTRERGVWNVVQQVNPSTGGSLIFAFANGARASIKVWLRDVKSDLSYELRSADRGRLGILRGADLIATGLEIHETPESAAQILVLEPVSDTAIRQP